MKKAFKQTSNTINVLLAFSWMAFVATPAAGELTIYPTRLVFRDSQRTADLALMNNGHEATTYRLELLRQRMASDGTIVIDSEPQSGEQYADEWIRFSPRQFTLDPGKSQVVRVQIRTPADLPEGEYRSHLLFRALPSAPAAATGSDASPEGGGMTVALIARYGISIPLIVRKGNSSVTVEMKDVRVIGPAAAGLPPEISFDLLRNGNRSVYGDLEVSFTPRGGTAVIVARVKGVAVYVPNAARRMQLQGLPGIAQPLRHGQLRVSFAERPGTPSPVFAEKTADLR